MRIKGHYLGHICFFDRTCIKHYFELGTPLSIYLPARKSKHPRVWHVLPNTKRFEKMWGPPLTGDELHQARQFTEAIRRYQREMDE